MDDADDDERREVVEVADQEFVILEAGAEAPETLAEDAGEVDGHALDLRTRTPGGTAVGVLLFWSGEPMTFSLLL